MTHTPGPWVINEEMAGIDGPNGEQIVRRAGIAKWVHGNGKANAALMAASPDLLAACERGLSELDDPDIRQLPWIIDTKRQLRAAIAKAMKEVVA